jgi:alpha-1,3-rhamnosyl/mannosyltransferase
MTLPFSSLSRPAGGTNLLSGQSADQDNSAARDLRRDDAMKLILNVESIVPPVTGIGRYTSEILGGLLARGLGDNLHCFSHFRWVDARSVINAASGSPAPNRVRPFLRSLPYAYELRCIARNAVFRRSAKSLVGAVYHEPNYILKP